MGSTPEYTLPYPELTDSANVPRDVQSLAEAVEAAVLSTIPPTPTPPTPVWSGRATISLTNDAIGSTAVTFPVGRFATAPNVTATASSSAQVVAVSNVTATGLTVTIRQADGTPSTTTITVHIHAIKGG
jgi:hypothetical protein